MKKHLPALALALGILLLNGCFAFTSRTTAPAEIRAEKSFHDGDITVTLVSIAPLSWELRIRVKEGVGTRVRFVQEAWTSDVVVFSALGDNEEGKEKIVRFFPMPSPDSGSYGDLLILAQNGRGVWETDTIPSEIFSAQ